MEPLYRVEVKRSVEKEIARLPRTVQGRVLEAIEALAVEPRPDGCKKLRGRDQYAVRVGDYRIVYTIDDAGRLVVVLLAKHRRDVYRYL